MVKRPLTGTGKTRIRSPSSPSSPGGLAVESGRPSYFIWSLQVSVFSLVSESKWYFTSLWGKALGAPQSLLAHISKTVKIISLSPCSSFILSFASPSPFVTDNIFVYIPVWSHILMTKGGNKLRRTGYYFQNNSIWALVGSDFHGTFYSLTHSSIFHTELSQTFFHFIL